MQLDLYWILRVYESSHLAEHSAICFPVTIVWSEDQHNTSGNNSRMSIPECKKDIGVAVVVELLACLPVTQKIGVRFYLERESSATSGWINVGREWCCRGCWSIEGGTNGGLFIARGGLPRIRKARPLATSTSVRVCVNEIKTLYLRRNGCLVWMLVCVLYFTVYVYVCVQTKMCVFHCTALRALMM